MPGAPLPNRIIRDSILTSERVASLNWPDEVFYRRLMSIVDDYGRHEASPLLLRSRCYPLQTDLVRVADISRSMTACQKAGLIVLYEVAGKQYLQIENFGQQRRSASKCPAPDGKCDQVIPPAQVDVSVFGVGGVSPPTPRKRGVPKRAENEHGNTAPGIEQTQALLEAQRLVQPTPEAVQAGVAALRAISGGKLTA